MLRVLNVDCEITGDPQTISRAKKIILPGVGAFDHGMQRLRELNLIEVLNQKVLGENPLNNCGIL